MLAHTPEPPYYTVVFSSLRTAADPEGYNATAARMEDLARLQPGFLGVESARGPDGFGITVSYWESLDAIAAWKTEAGHREAQARGRSDWYQSYRLRVGRVDREYGG